MQGAKTKKKHFQVTGDWSKTGGAGEPQPDNREFKVGLSLRAKLSISLMLIHNITDMILLSKSIIISNPLG